MKVYLQGRWSELEMGRARWLTVLRAGGEATCRLPLGDGVTQNENMIKVSTDGGAAEMYRLEALGIRLVEVIATRAGLVGSATANPRPRVVGPHFDYRESSTLFAGRVDSGP